MAKTYRKKILFYVWVRQAPRLVFCAVLTLWTTITLFFSSNLEDDWIGGGNFPRNDGAYSLAYDSESTMGSRNRLRHYQAEHNDAFHAANGWIEDRDCFCGAESVAHNKLIILSNPWRYFSSAHWFHICEYYMPHHPHVVSRMVPNATVFIVAPSTRFLAKLSHMSMFLLILALTDGSPLRVEVLPRVALHLAGESIFHVQGNLPGTLVYDSRLPLPYRFQRVKLSGSSDLKNSTPLARNCICAKLIAELGGAPIERGFWFDENGGTIEARKTAVRDTRRRVENLCSAVSNMPVQTHSRVSSTPFFHWKGGSTFSSYAMSVNEGTNNYEAAGGLLKPLRLVLYQRNRDRVLKNQDGALTMLQKRLGLHWKVTLAIHDEMRHPCDLWHILRDTDLLLTPHGFQSILLIFMPPGSAIFELFPYKYWKDGYRPFANEYGVHHGWSQSQHATTWFRQFVLSFISQEFCMRWSKCREYARRDDVVIDEVAIEKLLGLLDRNAAI